MTHIILNIAMKQMLFVKEKTKKQIEQDEIIKIIEAIDSKIKQKHKLIMNFTAEANGKRVVKQVYQLGRNFYGYR